MKTNIPFLGEVIRDPRFQKGEYDTTFLEDFEKQSLRPDLLTASIVAAVLHKHTQGTHGRTWSKVKGGLDPWKSYGRMKGMRRI